MVRLHRLDGRKAPVAQTLRKTQCSEARGNRLVQSAFQLDTWKTLRFTKSEEYRTASAIPLKIYGTFTKEGEARLREGAKGMVL